jgi:hypothetical protein
MSTRKKATSQGEAQQITDEVKQQMEPVAAPAETTALVAPQPAGPTEIVVSEAGEYDFGGDAGGGHEQRRAEDNFVPRLSILQGLSKPVKACKDGSVRAGMVHHSGSGIVWDGDKGVEMILCFYKTEAVEWIPLEKHGGGFVGIHNIDADYVQMAIAKAREANGGKMVAKVPTGNFTEDGKPTEFVETTTAFGFVIEGGEMMPFCYAHKSTHLTPLKQLTSNLANFRLDPRRDKAPPPMFAFRIRLKTWEKPFTPTTSAYLPAYEAATKEGPGPVFVYGADGKERTFHPAMPGQKGLRASIVPTSSAMYSAAKKLRDDVAKGLLKVDHAADEQAGGKPGAADDQEIPF